MAEQRFLYRQRSAVEQPPVPVTNLNRTGIEINFGEAVTKIIEIRRQHIDVALKACSIYLKPVYQRAHDAQFALDAQIQMIFASRSERRVT